MSDQEQLARLTRELYPDNGVEFLSAVVCTIANESIVDYLLTMLELENA